MPKVIPKIEDSKRISKQDTKVLHKYMKYPDVNINECIDKLRKEPDFRKNMFMMDVNACIMKRESYFTSKGPRYGSSGSTNSTIKEEISNIYKLSNICGAFVYDSFIPGVTTHIIANYPDKQILGKAGSLDNSTSPYVVTTQWLIDSVISGSKEDEKMYLPPDIHMLSNSFTVQQPLLARKTQSMFGTVFKDVHFSIVTKSYTKEECEDITTKIESNGGSVISEQIVNSCAKYLIMNDGADDWKGFILSKNSEGKYIVSHRFLDRCLTNKKIIRLEKEKAMDLLPFPYKIPYDGFSKFCVAFALFDSKSKDLGVLNNIAELLGMRNEFNLHTTTHVILNTELEHQLDKSQKINQIKRAFDPSNSIDNSMLIKPKVVKFEWFLECLLNGREEPEDNYLINID